MCLICCLVCKVIRNKTSLDMAKIVLFLVLRRAFIVGLVVRRSQDQDLLGGTTSLEVCTVRLHLNSAKPYPSIEHSACQFSSQSGHSRREAGGRGREKSSKQNQVLDLNSCHFTVTGCTTLIHRVEG